MATTSAHLPSKVGGSSGSTYDAIVVGGGHNGLTTAAYLAKAGQKVSVHYVGTLEDPACPATAYLQMLREQPMKALAFSLDGLLVVDDCAPALD